MSEVAFQFVYEGLRVEFIDPKSRTGSLNWIDLQCNSLIQKVELDRVAMQLTDQKSRFE